MLVLQLKYAFKFCNAFACFDSTNMISMIEKVLDDPNVKIHPL